MTIDELLSDIGRERRIKLLGLVNDQMVHRCRSAPEYGDRHGIPRVSAYRTWREWRELTGFSAADIPDRVRMTNWNTLRAEVVAA